MPHIKKNVGLWMSSLTVQNVGSPSTHVTVHFFYQSGNPAGPNREIDLAPGHSYEFYSELPSGVTSAWIHSDRSDVVAAVHETHIANPDRSMGYSAVP
jgi:hypothetical protein